MGKIIAKIEDNLLDTLVIETHGYGRRGAHDSVISLTATERATANGDISCELDFNPDKTQDVIRGLRDALENVGVVNTGVEKTTRAAPNGAQKYRGNGKHEWERVVSGTRRLRVPGGFIYQTGAKFTTFVPMPDVVGYAV